MDSKSLSHVASADAEGHDSIQRPLSEERITAIVNDLPEGLKGFCAGWGWLDFARAIEVDHGIDGSRPPSTRERDALWLIAGLPLPEQDNMVAANMRKIARDALQKVQP